MSFISSLFNRNIQNNQVICSDINYANSPVEKPKEPKKESSLTEKCKVLATRFFNSLSSGVTRLFNKIENLITGGRTLSKCDRTLSKKEAIAVNNLLKRVDRLLKDQESAEAYEKVFSEIEEDNIEVIQEYAKLANKAEREELREMGVNLDENIANETAYYRYLDPRE